MIFNHPPATAQPRDTIPSSSSKPKSSLRKCRGKCKTRFIRLELSSSTTFREFGYIIPDGGTDVCFRRSIVDIVVVEIGAAHLVLVLSLLRTEKSPKELLHLEFV